MQPTAGISRLYTKQLRKEERNSVLCWYDFDKFNVERFTVRESSLKQFSYPKCLLFVYFIVGAWGRSFREKFRRRDAFRSVHGKLYDESIRSHKDCATFYKSSLPKAEDVKALLSDAMLHCTTNAVASKSATPGSKQENTASPLSTANSRLLASNIPGSGDGASTERPAMELPSGILNGICRDILGFSCCSDLC